MKFKKLLVLTLACTLLFGIGNAFATTCGGQDEPACGKNIADTSPVANGASSDDSDASTGLNDNANSFAFGSAGGTLTVHADAGYDKEPIFEEVHVSNTWEKEEAGRYINVGNYNGDYYKWGSDYYECSLGSMFCRYDKVPGEVKEQDFPINAKPEGWTFVRANTEIQQTGWNYIPKPADAYGTILGYSESKAWSWAKDYGLTSKAGAGAKFEGFAISGALALGVEGCEETIVSDLFVGGTVAQANNAGEIGYNAGGVSGGNQSSANFYATDTNSVSGDGYAYDGNYISGSAITKGDTKVSIDPTGNFRSISAKTSNFASIETSGVLQSSNVQGTGAVGGVISNGLSFAGGTSSFSYNGSTFGTGNATLNSSVVTGPNSTTVISTGSAHSFSN